MWERWLRFFRMVFRSALAMTAIVLAVYCVSKRNSMMRHPHNLPLFLRAKQDGRADAFLLCLASVISQADAVFHNKSRAVRKNGT